MLLLVLFVSVFDPDDVRFVLVFQIAVINEADKQYWNNYKSDNEFWIDHLGTGYYIPKSNINVTEFEKNYPQTSRFQNSGEFNSENWVNLVFNHGKSPKGASYEYVVLPQTKFNFKNKKAIKSSYEIMQHDRNAHIVKDKELRITSFAFFETPKLLPQSIIATVDTTCLIMLEEVDKNVVSLTVSNPDLALYRGSADEIYDEHGKRIERSIYSRPWIGNESQEIPVTVTLNGEWNMRNNDGFVLVNIRNGKTVLTFKCKDAASINVELKKYDKN